MADLRVLVKKEEPKCKLCRHQLRPEIDRLLLRRSQREKLEDGRAVNLEYVLARLGEMGVENPNADNVKIHWTKHCEVVSGDVADAQENALLEMINALTPEQIAGMSPQERINWIAQVGMAQEMARIEAGGTTSITIDHVLRAEAELRQRKQEESTTRLLGELVGGVAHALKQKEEPKQIGDSEVVEQEPVVIEA